MLPIKLKHQGCKSKAKGWRLLGFVLIISLWLNLLTPFFGYKASEYYSIYARDKPQEVEEEKFVWGVMAINMNKSVYKVGEEALIQMAVLNDEGLTLCDADLSLEIVTPSGQTANPKIITSDDCGPDNVTDKPDYTVLFPVKEAGLFKLTLTDLSTGYKITDSFEAKFAINYNVERVGPTRIFPPADYEMKLIVTSENDFSGVIEESVPANFEIINTVPVGLTEIKTDDLLIFFRRSRES